MYGSGWRRSLRLPHSASDKGYSFGLVMVFSDVVGILECLEGPVQ